MMANGYRPPLSWMACRPVCIATSPRALISCSAGEAACSAAVGAACSAWALTDRASPISAMPAHFLIMMTPLCFAGCAGRYCHIRAACCRSALPAERSDTQKAAKLRPFAGKYADGGAHLRPPARSGEVAAREFPVRQRPEPFQVLGTGVAVIDVVGVLPHIDGQQRGLAVGDRRGRVAGVDDVQFIAVFHQPGPAGTEVADGGVGEGFLEFVEGAPFGVDGVGQRAGRLATA